MWPPESIVVTTRRMTSAFPTTAPDTAATMRSTVSANHAASSGVMVAACSWVVVIDSLSRYGRASGRRPSHLGRQPHRTLDLDPDGVVVVAEVDPRRARAAVGTQCAVAGQPVGALVVVGVDGHAVVEIGDRVVARREILVVEVEEAACGARTVGAGVTTAIDRHRRVRRWQRFGVRAHAGRGVALRAVRAGDANLALV